MAWFKHPEEFAEIQAMIMLQPVPGRPVVEEFVNAIGMDGGSEKFDAVVGAPMPATAAAGPIRSGWASGHADGSSADGPSSAADPCCRGRRAGMCCIETAFPELRPPECLRLRATNQS